MHPGETYVQQAGVFRCCLASINEQLFGDTGKGYEPVNNVELGHQVTCEYCDEVFELQEFTGNAIYRPLSLQEDSND